MTLRNLLILVDLSEVTPALLRYGVQLAASLSARIWVQHIYYFPPDLAGDVLIPEDALERYQAQAEQKLEKLKEGVASLTGHPLHCLVKRGDLIVQATRTIKQKNIDLVIIGNRGGGLPTNILGSHTLKIIYHVPCPVLSVPEKVSFQPLRRIAFASDWHTASPNSIQQLTGLTEQLGAHLDVIHISTEEKTAEDKPDKLLGLEGLSYTLHYLWDQNIENGLKKQVAEHHIDLLVLIPHQHSFFDRLFQKSITRQMVYHSQIPLLTLHE